MAAEMSTAVIKEEEVEKSDENTSEKCEDSVKYSPLREELLDHVAHSKARFKNEQIGEPGLTWSQKREMADKILDSNPGQFLGRFGNYIKREHLKYFENFRKDIYEVEIYCQQLQQFHSTEAKRVEVKNRRYAALKKLVSEGSYFSETEMRRRNPLLYEQLIGQYLSEEEQREINTLDMNSMTLLGLLLEHMDRDETRSLRVRQQELEEGAMEESDDDESVDEEEEMEEAPEQERTLLRHEFVSHMYRNFLQGHDQDFDYSTVDSNTEYDSLEVRQRDAEDSYFDSETPKLAPDSPLPAFTEECTVPPGSGHSGRTKDVAEPPERTTDPAEEEEDELDAYMMTLPPVAQQVDWA